jgi:hypothetical protein
MRRLHTPERFRSASVRGVRYDTWPCTKCCEPSIGTVMAGTSYFEVPCGCGWDGAKNLNPAERAMAVLMMEGA